MCWPAKGRCSSRGGCCKLGAVLVRAWLPPPYPCPSCISAVHLRAWAAQQLPWNGLWQAYCLMRLDGLCKHCPPLLTPAEQPQAWATQQQSWSGRQLSCQQQGTRLLQLPRRSCQRCKTSRPRWSCPCCSAACRWGAAGPSLAAHAAMLHAGGGSRRGAHILHPAYRLQASYRHTQLVSLNELHRPASKCRSMPTPTPNLTPISLCSTRMRPPPPY